MRNLLPSFGALLAAAGAFAALLSGERPRFDSRGGRPVEPGAQDLACVPAGANGRAAPWPDPPPPRGRELFGPPPAPSESRSRRRFRSTAPDPEREDLREELARAWRKIRGDEGTRADLWEDRRWSRPSPARLAALFPESDLARSYEEYAGVRGGGYYLYAHRNVVGDFKYRPEVEIPGFAAWVDRYPGHPGQDDASYRLGRCFGIEGRGIEAVRWFRRAQAVPDGDMAAVSRTFEILFLESLLPDDDLRYLAETGDLRAGWSFGVRLLRAGRYRESRVFLKASLAALPRWWRAEGVAQIEATGELQDLERAVAAAGDPDARARALYAIGRRQYHDPWLYGNLLWGSAEGRDDSLERHGVFSLLGHDGAPESYRANWRAGNHRLRARETFLRIAREHPGSDLVAAARYSAAAALAHTIKGSFEARVVQCPAETRIAAAREFDAFARDFPASTLADDALLTAGRLTRNEEAFLTILGRYPSGDQADAALAELAPWRNNWPEPDSVPGNLGRMDDREGRGGEWYAEEVEKVLGFCVGRILRAKGEERGRAAADLRAWFERSRGALEFDPVAGAWLLF